jgi:lipopolysaccharide transport system permease protein
VSDHSLANAEVANAKTSNLSRVLADNARALKNWRVWWHFGMADVRNKFAKSFVGPAWLLLNLLLWVGGIGVIYAALFQQDVGKFLPFLAIGFVVWGFLTQSLTEGGNAFVNAEGYIKQFTFPKQIYILRVIVNALIPFAIGMLIAIGVLLVLQRPFGFAMLWALPGVAIVLVANFLHATIMAYMGARFRDLPHGLSALLQVLFFVTPVFFTTDVLQKRGLDFVYAYNPLYYLIEVVRYPMVNLAAAPMEIYAAAGAYLAVLLIVALAVASRLDRRIVYIL